MCMFVYSLCQEAPDIFHVIILIYLSKRERERFIYLWYIESDYYKYYRSYSNDTCRSSGYILSISSKTIIHIHGSTTLH